MRVVLTTLLATLALAACDGGGDPVEQALRDASAANHAATVREGEVTAAMGTASDSADEAYIARMIEHHRGAVVMADVVLAESRDPEIRRMAQAVKAARTREIAEMRAWRPAPPPTP